MAREDLNNRFGLLHGGAIMALADNLVELKAVCECGRKATMNLRVDQDGFAVARGAQTEILRVSAPHEPTRAYGRVHAGERFRRPLPVGGDDLAYGKSFLGDR